MDRTEFITRGDCEPAGQLGEGVQLRVFASGSLGSRRLTTCEATIQPGAAIPYHTHPTGEAIVVLRGEAAMLVEGRRYLLRPFDAMHVPPGVAHSVQNPSGHEPAVLHTSFPTDAPDRDFVEDTFPVESRETTDDSCPEALRRFEAIEAYELGDQVVAKDLFAARFGSSGICGGHARFKPGASLPCHTHDYDESITIIAGTAVSQVAGKQYELSGNDTACIPQDRPHRFLNWTDEWMEMIWVYAGDEPDRQLVDQSCCAPPSA